MRRQLSLAPSPAGARLITRAEVGLAPAKIVVREGLSPKKADIPSVARNLIFVPDGGHTAPYSDGVGGPAGTVEGFGGIAGFDGIVGFVADAGMTGAVAFPTVRYLRIFSSRFGPMPRIALKSSTLLNAPYDLRICKIFSAVTGPIPGTNGSSSDIAEFRLTGAAGGFFFAGTLAASAQNAASRRIIRAIAK